MADQGLLTKRYKVYNILHKSFVTVLLGVFIFAGVDAIRMAGTLRAKSKGAKDKTDDVCVLRAE